MPGFNGTGPQGRGPMTGKGMGFCILKESKDKSDQANGFVGIQGMPVNQYSCEPSYTTSLSVCGRDLGRSFGCGFRGGRNRFGW